MGIADGLRRSGLCVASDAQYAWGPLAVELCFKVARLHADGKPTRYDYCTVSSYYHQRLSRADPFVLVCCRHVESLSYIMKAMSIVNLPLPVQVRQPTSAILSRAPPCLLFLTVVLSSILQVMRSLESAALSRLLRLPRKFSFFLRLAAIQSFELQSYTSAHELGRVAAGTHPHPHPPLTTPPLTLLP